MKENAVCSFFGHREIEVTDDLYATLTAEILKAVDFGCRAFYFGGYGEFDALCHGIVTKIKEENPHLNITRTYCVAQEKYLRKRCRYFRREDYDEVIYLEPSFDYWYTSIYYRNCAMIDASDYIIFYAEKREGSGAYKAYEYAKRKSGETFVNIFEN